MCDYEAINSRRLIKHIVQLHKTNPRFKIRCFINECGATYDKWKSFQKHVQRDHPDSDVVLDFNFDNDAVFEQPRLDEQGI